MQVQGPLMKLPLALYKEAMPRPNFISIEIRKDNYKARINGETFNLYVSNNESLISWNPFNKEVFMYIRQLRNGDKTAIVLSYVDLDFMLKSQEEVLQSFGILEGKHLRDNLFQIVCQNGDELTLKKVNFNIPSALDNYSDDFGRFNAAMSAFIFGSLGTSGKLDKYLELAKSCAIDTMIGLFNEEGIHIAIERIQARIDEIMFDNMRGFPSPNTLSSIFGASVIMGGFIGSYSGIGFLLGALSSQFGLLGASVLGVLRCTLNYDHDEVVKPVIGGIFTALVTAILARHIYNGGSFLRSGPQDAKDFRDYHKRLVNQFLEEDESPLSLTQSVEEATEEEDVRLLSSTQSVEEATEEEDVRLLSSTGHVEEDLYGKMARVLEEDSSFGLLRIVVMDSDLLSLYLKPSENLLKIKASYKDNKRVLDLLIEKVRAVPTNLEPPNYKQRISETFRSCLKQKLLILFDQEKKQLNNHIENCLRISLKPSNIPEVDQRRAGDFLNYSKDFHRSCLQENLWNWCFCAIVGNTVPEIVADFSTLSYSRKRNVYIKFSDIMKKLENYIKTFSEFMQRDEKKEDRINQIKLTQLVLMKFQMALFDGLVREDSKRWKPKLIADAAKERELDKGLRDYYKTSSEGLNQLANSITLVLAKKQVGDLQRSFDTACNWLIDMHLKDINDKVEISKIKLERIDKTSTPLLYHYSLFDYLFWYAASKTFSADVISSIQENYQHCIAHNIKDFIDAFLIDIETGLEHLAQQKSIYLYTDEVYNRKEQELLTNCQYMYETSMYNLVEYLIYTGEGKKAFEIFKEIKPMPKKDPIKKAKAKKGLSKNLLDTLIELRKQSEEKESCKTVPSMPVKVEERKYPSADKSNYYEDGSSGNKTKEAKKAAAEALAKSEERKAKKAVKGGNALLVEGSEAIEELVNDEKIPIPKLTRAEQQTWDKFFSCNDGINIQFTEVTNLIQSLGGTVKQKSGSHCGLIFTTYNIGMGKHKTFDHQLFDISQEESKDKRTDAFSLSRTKTGSLKLYQIKKIRELFEAVFDIPREGAE